MAQQKKEIASIEILHLDETGYGPEGKHTRREWREECLTNLLAGKDQFLAWQESWKALAEKNDREVSFGLVVSHYDGTKYKHYDARSYATASHALDFNGSHFKSRLDCQQFHFQFYSLFGFARFSGDAYFSESQFSGDVYFTKSMFSGDAYFTESKFSGHANFIESQFSGNAYFSESQISGNANFSESQFFGYVYFIESQFSGNAYFSASQFSGDTNFQRAGFTKGSDFSQTSFKQSADFENASFANVGHFEQARFDGSIPSFRGCKIDGTRLEFSDESYFTQNDHTEDAIKNISFLKRLSDQHGQVDQAIEFNAMELRAKRQHRIEGLSEPTKFLPVKSDDWWATRVTWVYEYVSDFGRSFIKPLILYCYLLLIIGYL